MKTNTARQGLFVIANAGEARLFARVGGQWPLQPLETIQPVVESLSGDHGLGRHAGHMVRDGRPGGTTLSPRMDPLRKRHLAFAKQLSELIDQSIKNGSCDELVIAASCPFLAALQSSLSVQAKKRLISALDVDLTSFGLTELEHRLEGHLHRTVDHDL